MNKRKLILATCAVAVLIVGVICGFFAGRYIPPEFVDHGAGKERGCVQQIEEMENGSTVIHFIRWGGREIQFLVLPDTAVMTGPDGLDTDLSTIPLEQYCIIFYEGTYTGEMCVCYVLATEFPESGWPGV